MPGHKGKACDDMASWLAQNMWNVDVTELPDTDNLHMPQGPIAQAQRLMAEAVGADESFFMVNGSTGGVYAMMLSVCRPGDSIIVARNCHKSVINGLVLAGLNPIYIWPDTLDEWHIAGQVTPEQIDGALLEHPEVTAVLITSPDYYGLCADVEGIAQVCHNHNIPLLVDEAHGGHFPFHPKMPPSAGRCGADIWVNSLHKTLPALTQASVLHMRRGLVDQGRIKKALKLVQTTSPSYVFMASMDIARYFMVHSGYGALDELMDSIADIAEAVQRMRGILMMGEEVAGKHGVAFKDPTRLCFNVSGLGMTGYGAEAILKRAGVQVEFGDIFNIVLIATVMDNTDAFAQLKNALCGLAANEHDSSYIWNKMLPVLPEARQVMAPREASLGEVEYIPVIASKGRIAAEAVGMYPPGIPLICPGEAINGEIIDILNSAAAAGCGLFGLENDKIAVVKESRYV